MYKQGINPKKKVVEKDGIVQGIGKSGKRGL